jgi:hypothetical protein
VVRKTDISGKLVQFAWWAVATIAFALIVAIRIRLLGIPLERDEGEYAYAGQLILQGIPPYKLAYTMKVRGTYVGYSLIMSIFGQNIYATHLGRQYRSYRAAISKLTKILEDRISLIRFVLFRFCRRS